jgi:hypothetical protein
MRTTAYDPPEPYILKSGRSKGKSLEELMFKNYSLLAFLFAKCRENQEYTNMCFHLSWLIQRGENRIAKAICPHCGIRPVQFFSVIHDAGGRGDFAIIQEAMACGDCEEILKERFSQNILPFRFSTLGRFKRPGDYRRIKELFESVFGVSRLIKKEEAFEFFKADGTPQK